MPGSLNYRRKEGPAVKRVRLLREAKAAFRARDCAAAKRIAAQYVATVSPDDRTSLGLRAWDRAMRLQSAAQRCTVRNRRKGR